MVHKIDICAVLCLILELIDDLPHGHWRKFLNASWCLPCIVDSRGNTLVG
jgi:hypothetical protein